MVSFILPGNSASTGYEVANSLRFEDSSTDYLQRTFGTSSNSKKFTWSFWIKRSRVGTSEYVFENVGSHTLQGSILFDSSDRLQMYEDGLGSGSGMYLITNRKFRDVAAWYHIVIAVDSTQATDTNRAKMYVNGVQETSLATSTYPSQDHALPYISGSGDPCNIGKYDNTNSNLSGYLCEMVFKDGAQLDPTSFGEFDSNTNIWIPKDLSDLDFSGTNTFHLDFENSSSLGADVSGNGNNFTVNNLTSIDQSTDTCTNNYCTLNPLDPTNDITLTEGNCKAVYGTSGTRDVQGSTFGVSSGKWYWEIKIGGSSDPDNAIVGITQLSTDNNTVLGTADNSWGYRGYDGKVYHNNSSAMDLGTFGNTDIIGVYMDLDNHKLYFAKNGSLQNSTGISLDTGQDYFPAISDAGSSATPQFEMNFGAGTTFSISSGNTDGEYGNFEYSTTITGDSASKTFKALNTKNLAAYG